jgi:hypothetical protein
MNDRYGKQSPDQIGVRRVAFAGAAMVRDGSADEAEGWGAIAKGV